MVTVEIIEPERQANNRSPSGVTNNDPSLHRLWWQPCRLLWNRFWFHFISQLKQISWTLKGSTLLILLCCGILNYSFLQALPWLWWIRTLFRFTTLVVLILGPLIYLNPHSLDLVKEYLTSSLHSWENARDACLQHLASARLVRLLYLTVLVLLPLKLQMMFIEGATYVLTNKAFYYRSSILIVYVITGQGMVKLITTRRKCDSWKEVFASIKPKPGELHPFAITAIFYWLIVLSLSFFARMDGNWPAGTTFAYMVVLVVALVVWARERPHEQLGSAFTQSVQKSLPEVWQTVVKDYSQDAVMQTVLLRYVLESFLGKKNNDTTASSNNTTETSSHSGVSSSSSNNNQSQTETQWLALVQNLHSVMIQRDDGSTSANRQSSFVRPNSSPTSVQQQSNTSSALAIESSFNITQSNTKNASLASMLKSMDVDEHILPLLYAYKYSVQQLVPFRSTAIILATCSRCPSTIVWMLHLIWHSNMSWSFFVHWTLLLAPLMILELLRVQLWVHSLQRSYPQTLAADPTTKAVYLGEVHPLVILWSSDLHDKDNEPHPLVKLYRVTEESVKSFEKAITTTRCIQTTVVAADMASNAFVLAELAIEVQRQGWVLGVFSLLREYVAMQQEEEEQHTKYTHAANSLVQGSQKMRHNLRMLLQDENVAPVLHPILHALSVVFGNGWLWGREERPMPESTVTIEILDDDNSETAEDVTPIVRAVPSDKDDEAAVAATEIDDADDESSHDDNFVSLNKCGDDDDKAAIAADKKLAGNTTFQILASQRPQKTTESLHVSIHETKEANTGASVPSSKELDLTATSKSNDKTDSVPDTTIADASNPPAVEMVKIPSDIVTNDNTEEDISSLVASAMDLVSQCDEYDLVSKTDKIAMFEKLSMLKLGDDRGWVDGTIRSLELLLQANNHNVKEMQLEKLDINDMDYYNIISESQHDTPSSNDTEQHIEPLTPTLQKEEGNIPIEMVHIIKQGAVANATSHDDKLDNDEEGDDDSEYEPLASPPQLNQGNADPQSLQTTEVVQNTVVEHKEEQNMWANLAVAGVAVAGFGLAIINTTQGQRNRRKNGGGSSS